MGLIEKMLSAQHNSTQLAPDTPAAAAANSVSTITQQPTRNTRLSPSPSHFTSSSSSSPSTSPSPSPSPSALMIVLFSVLVVVGVSVVIMFLMILKMNRRMRNASWLAAVIDEVRPSGKPKSRNVKEGPV